MKAIVVREPYASLILRGEKTWEMRKAACHYRGVVAVISKGSGTVVGTAEIVDSLSSIDSLEEYAQAEPKHRVPQNLQRQAFSDGWRTPWVLLNGRRLTTPVLYKHPSGAVIWVNLSEDVTAKVRQQTQCMVLRSSEESRVLHRILGKVGSSLSGRAGPELHSAAREGSSSPRYALTEDLTLGDVSSESIRRVTITGGNLRNDHIYLPLDFFPEEAIGGENKSARAARTITVIFKPGQVVQTDVDRNKKIFRARSAVRDFFAVAGVLEGDVVCLTRTGTFCYEVTKES
ncbi:ASCH domain-containing protein [Bradyrhizobium huanghuaihaiense]|uniref:ASCH domain-containing protein n=1 Tax=Bradyrhizobium huanghuaihaiense TaxID=990078 RepID=A0A562QK80_9BRAD|nr:ASCH domain-containing protein [Bradyrhizobium huanghuaihaiense]TWI56456.1 ASCH domain-containing protein [Bradyrhizobium huanghuaihaiense]